MAQNLSRIMDLPIDQQQLDYYRSLIISGYSLTHTGMDYVLTLFPEEEDAPLLYRYKLYENDTGQELMASDWQQSNEIRFHITPLERYYWYNLDVEIKNADGDYSFTGRFRIILDEQNNDE